MPPSVSIDSYKIFFGGLFLILIALVVVFFLTQIVSADVFGVRSYLHEKSCDAHSLALLEKDRGSFLTSCKSIGLRQCTDASSCAGLPCSGGYCLVQTCKQDSDCPNALCGLHNTPYPNLCTMIDAR